MNRFSPQLESLGDRITPSASPKPVLMVIANQDYVVESRPLPVSAGGVNVALGDGSVRFISEPISGPGVDKSIDGGVPPAETHDDVWVDGKIITAENYDAIVFVGGWGSSMYQYG